MKQMPAGAFKARCLSVMKQVQATGEPVVVTKRGVPVVKVVVPGLEPIHSSLYRPGKRASQFRGIV